MYQKGLTIRAARVNYGYTQEAMAQKLGVSTRTYLNWENGLTVPKPMFLYAMAYILGMNADDLRVTQRPEKILKSRAL